MEPALPFAATAARPVTKDDHRTALEVLLSHADPEAGLFGPGSMMWRINRTTAVYVLGITQAAFMDVAHPVIANGIADHSRLFTDPTGRAHQTYSMLTTLVFGDVAAVRRTSRALFATHDRVSGHAAADSGAFRDGAPYAANEGNVLMWVHLTMWWVRLQTHQAVVGPLPAQDLARFYDEVRLLAGCFAIPDDLIPADHDAWDAYVRTGPTGALAASPDSRRIMAFLVDQIPRPARAHLLAFNSVIVPDVVREVLDLPAPGPATMRRHRRVLRVLRATNRFVPGPARELPPYRAALARIGGHRQDRVSAAIGRLLVGPSRAPSRKAV